MECNEHPRIEELRTSLPGKLRPERLQELARTVIETHREGGSGLLLAYAVKAGLVPAGEETPPRTLFYRIIRTIHPDQLPFLQKRLETAVLTDDLSELNRLDHLLSPLRTERTRRLQSYDISEYREEQGWERDDWGFYGDADEESRWEEADELTFLDAVKLSAVGNLDIDISPFELAQLDGTLDVSRYGLFDLDGAELCKNVTILDASENDLTSVAELSGADKLIELYLAGNGIYDISPLAALSSLELLDLEDNEVEDISPLLEMPELQLVNLRGNPVENRDLLRQLAEKGVVVIL